jgi:hypothetical protein
MNMDRKIEIIYIVGDYGGEIATFEKLSDARKELKENGEGRQSYIKRVWYETTTLSEESYIQHLR